MKFHHNDRRQNIIADCPIGSRGPKVLMRLIAFLAFLFIFGLYADISAMELGEISPDEWDIGPPESDPNTGAMVLFDRGVMEITGKDGIRLDRHVRLKVFNKDAAQSALTVEIPYFEKEKIKDLKAYTHLSDGRKIEVKDFFEKEAGVFRILTFTFPSVEDNVILEYKYRHEHRRYNFIDPWIFQREIYTKKSSFSVVLHDGIVYDFQKNNIPRQSSIPKEEMYPDGFKHGKVMYTWELEDMPALKMEPLMAMVNNYTAYVQLHLIAFYIFMDETSFVRNWADLGGFYQDWVDSFTLGAENLDSLAKSLCKDSSLQSEQIRNLYEFVRDSFETRGDFGAYVPDSGIVKLLDNGYGFASEKNILLVELLRARNIDAFPLLIGTREYSDLNEGTYSLRQFNRVICFAVNGADSLALDTKDKLVSYPYLPPEDLVKAGLLVNGEESRIVSLNHGKRDNCTQTITSLYLDADGSAICSTRVCVHGYAVGEYRNVLNDSLSHEKMIKDLLEGSQINYELKHCSLNLDMGGDSLLIVFALDLPQYASVVEDNLFINPFIMPLIKNPFTAKSRYFPVDFKYPFYCYDNVVVYLPESCELADMPTEISYKIDGARFSRSFFDKTASLELTAHLSVQDHMFFPDQYQDLKKMFDMISESYFDQIAIRTIK